jgi:putative transposase
MFVCMSLSEAAERVYDTDLSNDAWALIEPMLRVPRFGGLPRTTNIRAVLNAILYLPRTGC